MPLEAAQRNRARACEDVRRAHFRNSTVLVLSRKTDQDIIIDNQIRIVVVEVRDGRCRLGIEAPKDIAVDRGEVYEAKTGKRVSDVFGKQ